MVDHLPGMFKALGSIPRTCYVHRHTEKYGVKQLIMVLALGPASVHG